jgi:2,3-bisphosphoglycerate-independent phosphoglycerate mutase
MHVLMFFLDGVGLGSEDADRNPFFRAHLPALRTILGGELPHLRRRRIEAANGICLPLDANLGVPGLPQSGTGQTALFTGKNGARLAGKHFGPHPYSTLRPVIAEHNIFKQFLQVGKKPAFANVFPQRFFDYLKSHPTRTSVTTFSCMASGVPLRVYADLEAGNGISADITAEGWKTLGHPDAGIISPQEAGRRLVALAREFDFVLFEYWRTDHAGHAQSMTEAVEALERFDGLLDGVVGALDGAPITVVMTSDHGNIEDLSTKTHTRHPVPLVVAGKDAARFASALSGRRRRSSLCDVTPAIVEWISPHTPSHT